MSATVTTSAWDVLHTQRRHQVLYPAEPVVRFLVNNRDTLGAKTMLDVGCGQGRHLKVAAELGYQPSGVDFSPEALEQAKAYGPVLEGEMTSLPYPDDSFDVVLAWGTLYYGTGEMTWQALREIRRVLVVNGHGLISLRTDRDWRYGMGKHIAQRAIRLEAAGEPEDGMMMNFTRQEDLDWITKEFAGAECELAESTTRNGTRLDSDWQIVVRNG